MRVKNEILSPLAVLAALGLATCQERRVDDEPPPGAVEVQSDTLLQMPGDTPEMPPGTIGPADTTGVDRSPTPGETPPGGTTINFESGTATTGQGEEVPVGGVSSGGVTTREGVAPDTAETPR